MQQIRQFPRLLMRRSPPADSRSGRAIAVIRADFVRVGRGARTDELVRLVVVLCARGNADTAVRIAGWVVQAGGGGKDGEEYNRHQRLVMLLMFLMCCIWVVMGF